MKKRYLLLLAVLAALLLVALPDTANAIKYFESPFPMVQAHFLGDYWDNATGDRLSAQVDASVIGSQYFQGFPNQPYIHNQSQVQGLITVRYWVPLPDGSTAERNFTVRPKYHFSVDYWPGWPDAGAAASVAGYVIKSSGAGAPEVGDFYQFFFWDGAEEGLVQPNGTIWYYPDGWWLTERQDTPIWLRNWQRDTLVFFYNKGVNSFRLSEGDISIRNGVVFSE